MLGDGRGRARRLTRGLAITPTSASGGGPAPAQHVPAPWWSSPRNCALAVPAHSDCVRGLAGQHRRGHSDGDESDRPLAVSPDFLAADDCSAHSTDCFATDDCSAHMWRAAGVRDAVARRACGSPARSLRVRSMDHIASSPRPRRPRPSQEPPIPLRQSAPTLRCTRLHSPATLQHVPEASLAGRDCGEPASDKPGQPANVGPASQHAARLAAPLSHRSHCSDRIYLPQAGATAPQPPLCRQSRTPLTSGPPSMSARTDRGPRTTGHGPRPD